MASSMKEKIQWNIIVSIIEKKATIKPLKSQSSIKYYDKSN